jgi:hypothetical protein
LQSGEFRRESRLELGLPRSLPSVGQMNVTSTSNE